MGQVIAFHHPLPGQGTQGQEPTVGKLILYYMHEVLPLKAPTTQRQNASLLCRFAQEYGSLPVTALTAGFLRSWRDYLSLRLKPDSVRQYMDVVSGVLTVAVQELEWLPEHPMWGRKVRKPPLSRGRVRFLSPEEQERLLRACQESRFPGLYPLVLLALSTGARRRELLSLRWQDVDLEHGYLRLAFTKNGERRSVPVPTMALEVLRAFRIGRLETDWVIPRQCDKTAFPGQHAWIAARERAGLAGSFHFHDLRHTAASYLAMSGASLIEIAEILGHKTLAMVRRYSHFTPAHTQAVVERMSQRFIQGVHHEPSHTD